METANYESRSQVLTELRAEHNALLSFGDALDTKLNTVIGSGSLVLSVFSALGVVQAAPSYYWVVLTVSVLAYLVALVVAIKALRPTDYAFPIMADWDHVHATYYPLSGGELWDAMISQQLLAIDENKALLAGKGKAVNVSLVIFALCVIAMIGVQLELSILGSL